MSNLYERYRQGEYQQVYETLVEMQEAVYDEAIAPIAGQIAREMMKRVRWNVEVLVQRLRDLHYYFGEGFTSSKEQREMFEKAAPVLSGREEVHSQELQQLQEIVGPLPLTLHWWYQEVNGVNLVGTFPLSEKQQRRIDYGLKLDPLLIFPVESALEVAQFHSDELWWQQNPLVLISLDPALKYEYGVNISYSFKAPRQGFDFVLEDDPSGRTFVNYLRQNIKYGGFPGLEHDNRLSPEQFAYLTEGLLPF